VTARAERAAKVISAALLFFAFCAACFAHQMNLSTARITITPERAAIVENGIKGSDIDRALGTRISDAHGVQPEALAAARAAVAAYVRAHTLVSAGGGARCLPGASTVAPDGDGVAVSTRWACAGAGGRLRYRSTLLADIAPNPREIVTILSGPVIAQDLLDARRREVALTEAPRPGFSGIIGRYLAAGAERAFIGYSHIAFLVALLLWARQRRPVFKILGAFAAAHSLTFWLAALHVITVSASLVQPAVAASIAYAAISNFFASDIEKRWRAAAGFGLLHGLGYAAALQTFGVPAQARVAALASFNTGIEIALSEMVVLLVPLLLGLDRVLALVLRHPARMAFAGDAALADGPAAGRAASTVYAASSLIAALGFWLLARSVLAA
jgi:hydrogenase/urease accessory protein HupE